MLSNLVKEIVVSLIAIIFGAYGLVSFIGENRAIPFICFIIGIGWCYNKILEQSQELKSIKEKHSQ